MTKEIRNPADESSQAVSGSSSGLGHSLGFRHLSFVIPGGHFREWSVAFALLLLLLLLAVLAPGFFQKGQLLSILSSVVPVLIAACGVSLVIICRQFDISIGSQFELCSIFLGL